MPDDFRQRAKEVLRSSDPLDGKIRSFTTLLSEFLDNALVSILLFDGEVEEFFIRGTTARFEGGFDGIRYSAGGTVDYLSLVEKRPVSLREVNRPADSRLRAEYYAFPMTYGGDLIGVVQVQHVGEEGADEGKLKQVEESVGDLAGVVAMAIKEETISQRMTKIAAINEAGVNIISTLDLERLLNLVATSAALIMEAEICIVRLYDEDSGKYTIREYYGMKSDEVQKKVFHLDRLVVVDVLRTGKPVHIRDLGEVEKYREFEGYARSLICYPMKEQGEVIGTITVVDKISQKTFYPVPFTREDVNNFEKFIRYVEKAVANAITFEKSEKLKNVDDLTGLPNLKYFQNRLMTELNRARRFSKKLVLMICEVIPHVTFKDFYVRGKGDRIIKRIARTIRSSLREYDVVARISETKFGIILPEAEDGRISAIPRIRKAIENEMEKIRGEGKEIRVDVRFGHATYPDDGDDYEKLIFKTNILKM
ncbi:MAG: diguanylate cyclase [Deltaproteobacteria bacterium]|nr:MAG: diguanylate cyclase [Deltaproteobacteria bacterium]